MIEPSKVALALNVGTILCPIEAMTAEARESIFTAHAKSGEPSRIRIFFDCRTHAPVSNVTGAFVEHGSVSFKDSVRDFCGVVGLPVREVWYTSDPGFKGVDRVSIPRALRFQTIIDVTVE